MARDAVESFAPILHLTFTGNPLAFAWHTICNRKITAPIAIFSPARENNYRLDANQELSAIGISNILGSFVGAYPVTGSFSRTAVNSQSGSRSPLGGLFTGALVLIAMAVLTGYFHYIPQAALGAIIIIAVLQMTDFRLLLIMWRVRSELRCAEVTSVAKSLFFAQLRS